jgi:hypothetical protein
MKEKSSKEKKGKKKGNEGKNSKAENEDVNRLEEHLEVQRTRVICGPELNYHVCPPRNASPDPQGLVILGMTRWPTWGRLR